MRHLLFVLLLLVVLISSSAFSCGRCRAPNCERVRVCDPYGNCEWQTRRRFLVDPDFQSFANSPGSYVGIFDIANGWQPATSANAQAKIKLENSSGQYVEQTFALTYSDTISQTIDSVDKDTTPYAFVVTDTSAMSNFFNSSFVQSYDENVEVTLSLSVTQVDCNLSSGTYINHTRLKDSSGVTYMGAFNVIYTAPLILPACNQGTITFEEY